MSKRVSKFTLATGVGLAIATFTFFACSSDGPNDNSSGSTCSADFRTVPIGAQTWMAENLNCDVGGSKCYDNDPANCNKYGRLYNWEAAKRACPSGWHLPSDAEWTMLTDYVGGESTAGTKLKAASGWNDNGNGTDEYGFSALPGGDGRSDGRFGHAGGDGHWWSATEYDAGNAWSRLMQYDNAYVGRDNREKSTYFSVRCLRD